MSNLINKVSIKQQCEHQQECLKKIQAILDGEATQADIEHFKTHNLQECLPCVENYALEMEVRKILQQRVEKKCCPEKIASNIKMRLGFALLLLTLVYLEVHICAG